MNILKTIAVAFSMFSAIPMPQFPWEEKNTKYMMCAFPLIGLICGLALWGWYELTSYCGLGNFLWAVGITLLPLIITGGVHMDGYCDTMDARSSHGEKEKKLEILSDPHIGAFGVLSMVCYLLIYLGVAVELEKNIDTVVWMSLVYIFSRCISARSIASLPCAKHTGLAHAFADMASKQKVKMIMSSIIFGIGVTFMMLNPLRGAVTLVVTLLTYLWWKSMMKKEFGGLTGDLAGYWVQKLELYLLITLLLLS